MKNVNEEFRLKLKTPNPWHINYSYAQIRPTITTFSYEQKDYEVSVAVYSKIRESIGYVITKNITDSVVSLVKQQCKL